MDYEKKYKEMKARVLEMGRGYVKGLDYSKPRQIAEYIDPELKEESADERIINRIKKAVENYWSDEPLNEILAWLEKKELKKIEQKSVDKVEPKFRIGDFVKNTNYQGEPIYEIVYIDKECYICEYRGKENMGDKTVMHFAFDNPYLRLVEQNPAWSEEDERNLQGIIDEIEANKNHAPDYDVATYDRFLSWLKSLRPQDIWKPSNEQISALEWQLSNISDSSWQYKATKEIYEHLKQL